MLNLTFSLDLLFVDDELNVKLIKINPSFSVESVKISNSCFIFYAIF